ncbi:hypothetical protein LCGC14_2595130 [marine sediment metagenome]|uniref:Uncharacterized protein n=1 Tax=marine sediment metagenome TaxID=412755 RepID=A0A0F9AAQ8_9ZZZZ
MKNEMSKNMENLIVAVDALRDVDLVMVETALSKKEAASLFHGIDLITKVQHALVVAEMGGVRGK